MRLCKHLTCEATATVWYHGGPWCARHALEFFGSTPALEARLGFLHHRQEPGSERPSLAGLLPPPMELLDLLSEKGWGLVDVEWACIEALEELA